MNQPNKKNNEIALHDATGRMITQTNGQWILPSPNEPINKKDSNQVIIILMSTLIPINAVLVILIFGLLFYIMKRK